MVTFETTTYFVTDPAMPPMTRVELLQRYGKAAVPRYTSYPPANVWRAMAARDARAIYARAAHGVGATAGQARDVSLYLHVPFCRQLCFYCGCNMMVTHNDALVERYVAGVEREVDLLAEATGGLRQRAAQLHLGGGTPTYLNEAQLTRVTRAMQRHFAFDAKTEMSIEVHPTVTSEGQVTRLAELGYTRLSVGVQDFDPAVQARINRHQTFEQTRDLISHARKVGFTSVNVDLMYGLPRQTFCKFDETLSRAGEIRPERVAVFGYAHMPSLKKAQRMFTADELPGANDRLVLLELAIERLTSMGYVHIGLDHFALPTDELCVAQKKGTLRRNFMGYTTGAETETLGVGPSSISEVGGAFVQNEKQVHAWAERVGAGDLPVVKGWLPTCHDDVVRDLLQQLFCRLSMDVRRLSAVRRGIALRLLDDADGALQKLERDGLLTRNAHGLTVSRAGQLFLRNIAATFDEYFIGANRQATRGTALKHAGEVGERVHSTAV